MESTYDAKEPLPRLYPVDVPVLFGSATNSSVAASTAAQGDTDAQHQPKAERVCVGADEDEVAAEEDQDDAVCKEMDACMRVLEGLKPKVQRIVEGVFNT